MKSLLITQHMVETFTWQKTSSNYHNLHSDCISRSYPKRSIWRSNRSNNCSLVEVCFVTTNQLNVKTIFCVAPQIAGLFDQSTFFLSLLFKFRRAKRITLSINSVWQQILFPSSLTSRQPTEANLIINEPLPSARRQLNGITRRQQRIFHLTFRKSHISPPLSLVFSSSKKRCEESIANKVLPHNNFYGTLWARVESARRPEKGKQNR